MAAAAWMAFAVAAMVGIFAGCVIAVAVGIRMIEAVREKRRLKRVG